MPVAGIIGHVKQPAKRSTNVQLPACHRSLWPIWLIQSAEFGFGMIYFTILLYRVVYRNPSIPLCYFIGGFFRRAASSRA